MRRTFFTVVAIAAIVSAVALRTSATVAIASRPGDASQTDTTVQSSFSVTVGDRVTFALTLTNNTGRTVEVRFPSGLTHDFIVQDSVGREVWRWSNGRLFTQVVQNRVIEKGESVTWVESWKRPDTTGTFVAVAKLQSRNYPVEQRAELVLPAQGRIVAGLPR